MKEVGWKQEGIRKEARGKHEGSKKKERRKQEGSMCEAGKEVARK